MWKSEGNKYSQAEVDKLNGLINAFEADNQNQKLVIESLEAVRIKQQERIDGYERKQQQLNKKIISLESTIKLERRGFEGLTKKCGLLELELPALKEEVGNLRQEQLRSRSIISQFEIDLNNDRAKRLQILHENQVLVDRNKHLEEEFAKKENELLASHKNQLANLQQLDTSMSSTETLQSIITEQNNSIITMCTEQQALQTQCRELTQINQLHSNEIGQLNMTVRAQEEEIRRLRGLILNNTLKPGTSSSNIRIGTTSTNRVGKSCNNINDLDALLFTSTAKEAPVSFNNTAKLSVYRDRVPGSDVTKKKIGSIDISNNMKHCTTTKKKSAQGKKKGLGVDSGSSDVSDDDSSEGGVGEGIVRGNEGIGFIDPPGLPELAKSFGFATSYVNPVEELEQLTAFNQYQQYLKRNPSPPLSPNANPYMPTPNKIICNKNYGSNSRPSSTFLTSHVRPKTANTNTYSYDASTIQAMQQLSGTDVNSLSQDMSKSMPNMKVPNVFSNAATATLVNVNTSVSNLNVLPVVLQPTVSSSNAIVTGGTNSPSNSMRKKKQLVRSTSTAKSLYIGIVM